MKYNFDIQVYKGIPLQLINTTYKDKKAKRFRINNTKENLWIPNRHLEEDGTINLNEDLDYIFRMSTKALRLARIESSDIMQFFI